MKVLCTRKSILYCEYQCFFTLRRAFVMEKTGAPTVNKAKNKFLSFLPRAAKAAATLRFEFDQNLPFSPDKHVNHHNRGNSIYHNSGPITSVILQEARSKSNNSRFDTKEPTSPKISCMGQIKIKKSKSKKKKKKDAVKPLSTTTASVAWGTRKKKSSSSAAAEIKNDSITSRKSDAHLSDSRAPSLSQMKRFASSRETLSNFDWTNSTAQVAPAAVKGKDHRRYYYSDEDRGNYSTDDDAEEGEEEEEEGVKIPFSAPLSVGGGAIRVGLEPRKEINLWKRRTMAQPPPLRLNK